MRLLNIPDEILLKTFKGADWKDLPALFSACRRLNSLKNTVIKERHIRRSTISNLAIRAAKQTDRKFLHTLLQLGADTNYKDECGNTALTYALTANSNNTVETVKLLLKYSANVNSQNNYGYTPLICASKLYESVETVKLLLRYNANANTRNIFGHTALTYASLGNSAKVVKLLKSHGARD